MKNHNSQSTAWKRLRQAFEASWPGVIERQRGELATSEVGCVVGLSGGADSVSLVRLLAEYWQALPARWPSGASRPPLVVAHYNHQLRGKDSDDDEQFAIDLANQWHLQIEVGSPRELPAADEASLRRQRYGFLSAVAAKHGCRVIALAHTADDQAETVLHHLFRGSGVAGMAGIRSGRGLDQDWVIRRPLLRCRAEWIREGLRSIDQAWREDASNQSITYTRNWLRHELLPLVHQRYPAASDAIVRAAESQAEADDLICSLAENWMDRHVDLTGDNEWLIARRENPHSIFDHPVVVVRALQLLFERSCWPRQAMTQSHWQRLLTLVRMPANETVYSNFDAHWPGGIEANVQTDRICLRRRQPTSQA